jgi:DNA replication protein DnaC
MQSIKIMEDLLQQLGLHGMQLALSGEELCDKYDGSFYEKLTALLTKEAEYKKSRSLAYKLKTAKFPSIKLLQDTKALKLVAHLNVETIIEKCENLFFIGGSGSAKTHLAIGLAYTALEQGKKVKFYTLADLARKLEQTQLHNYEMQFMLSLQRFDVLIIDELGYVPIDKKAGTLLFELLAKLYEKTSLFITTHLQFNEWGEMFGDMKSTKAIIDRLTHHSHIIETGNHSYRMKGGENHNKTNGNCGSKN